MTSKTLLPAGCYDLLPPFARQTSELSSVLLGVFESYGYEQVSPPLLEFTDGMLAGRGAALSPQIFRVMDPGAHKVMGIRPDITLQIARIAASRLAGEPRPLRLSYNGLILRMQGEQLRGDRQLRQTGIELIGASGPESDAEVILIAGRALGRVGIAELSIDLNLPGIVQGLLSTERLDNVTLEKLLSAIAHKDVSTIKTISFSYQQALIGLLQAAGPARAALAAIGGLDLPQSARQQVQALSDVVRILEERGSKHWTITVDATESNSFDYHSGMGFSIFAPGAACEIGRGGRYRIDTDEEATGFTLYVETLRSLLPEPKRAGRVLLDAGANAADTQKLQAEGYATLGALSGNAAEEAQRLGCSHIFTNGKLKKI